MRITSANYRDLADRGLLKPGTKVTLNGEPYTVTRVDFGDDVRPVRLGGGRWPIIDQEDRVLELVDPVADPVADDLQQVREAVIEAVKTACQGNLMEAASILGLVIEERITFVIKS